MKAKHLVIVAGGKATRLYPLSNYIPKFLVNIGKTAAYVAQVRYWCSEFHLTADDTLTVIVNSEYAEMTKAYHEMYFKDIPLIIKTVNEANGSAAAILETCSHLEGEDVLFTWCDVIPKSKISLDENRSSNLIFTNYERPNRYGVFGANNTVTQTPDGSGGCFGMYYIAGFRTDTQYNIGDDFIDIIHLYGPVQEQHVPYVIDFGDMPKLIQMKSQNDKAREFNSITEVSADYLMKSALNTQGEQIIEREISWYEALQSDEENVPTPKVFISPNRKSFLMSKVHGRTISEVWNTLSWVDRRQVFVNLLNGIDKIFDAVKPPHEDEPISAAVVLRDVMSEAHDKLIARYNEIKNFVEAFGPISVVNNYHLTEQSPYEMFNKIWMYLKQHYVQSPVNYGFIHGDIQFSNSMVDSDLNVTFIDPRGYFGKTQKFGLKDYDLGKVMYALNGYDLFNYGDISIESLGAERINFTIPEVSRDGIGDIIVERFRPVHELWAAICYLGLAQYIKNDPVKCVVAHYHGMYLANKFFDSLNTRT